MNPALVKTPISKKENNKINSSVNKKEVNSHKPEKSTDEAKGVSTIKPSVVNTVKAKPIGAQPMQSVSNSKPQPASAHQVISNTSKEAVR